MRDKDFLNILRILGLVLMLVLPLRLPQVRGTEDWRRGIEVDRLAVPVEFDGKTSKGEVSRRTTESPM